MPARLAQVTVSWQSGLMRLTVNQVLRGRGFEPLSHHQVPDGAARA